jgi:hypothetical protein
MEIERLPFGQSLSDKQRAGELKWRGMPPGLPPELADEFMVEFKAGSTIRSLTNGPAALCGLARYKKHCELHPEWALLANQLARANAKASDALKGAPNRDRTHCVNGHSFAEHGRAAFRDGFYTRQCRACETMRHQRGNPIKAEVLAKVTARFVAGDLISDLTKPGTSAYLVKSSTLSRHRREHPEFDQFVLRSTVENKIKRQKLRLQRIHTAIVRDDNNEYYKIRGMIPEGNPHRDDIVARIFEDLLTGSLERDHVPARIKTYVAEMNRLYPTKYRKFGDSLLVSLDEVMFDDGTTTRGDNVSRGLWD